MATIESHHGTETRHLTANLGELASFATLGRKLRRKAKSYAKPWYENILIITTPLSDSGGESSVIALAGNPFEQLVQRRGVLEGEYLSGGAGIDAMVIPYDIITAAAKGARRMMATITGGCLIREDGAVFRWDTKPSDAEKMKLDETNANGSRRDRGGHGSVSFAFAEAKDFIDTASIVLPAASKDDSRPLLTGVAYVIGDHAADWQDIDIVATDSYRLHMCSAQVYNYTMPSDDPLTLVLPATMLRCALAAKPTMARVNYNPDTGWASIATSETTTLYARTIDGQYPNARRLFPGGEAEMTVECDADTLVAALRGAAGAVGSRNARHRPATLATDSGAPHAPDRVLRVTVEEREGAPGFDAKVPGSVEAPQDYCTRANAAFLLDAANSIGTDTIRVRSYGETRPLVLDGGDAYNATEWYAETVLMMPTRV